MAIKKSAKKATKKKAKAVKKTAKKTKVVAKKKTNKKKTKKPIAKKKASLLSSIASHRRKLVEAKNKSRKSGEKLFKQSVKEIFKKFPEVRSFSWRQYTPYWNDGDECVFDCYLESMDLVLSDGSKNSKDLWTLQYLSELLSGDIEQKKKDIKEEILKTKEEWEKNSLRSKLKDMDTTPEEIGKINKAYLIKNAIFNLLDGIDRAAYESMFGEGMVNVEANKITVSECEHD